MREWVKDAVDQVLSLQPNSVLEIGCGFGLLLFRIAPHCSRYWGTDISQRAIKYVQEQLKTLDLKLSDLALFQKQADDFKGIEKESFDAVILSSVVQYFPDIHYLLQVLEGAVNAVKPGGFIFITKGLLKRCRDEEMLGCILAHEVGHVSAKHGLRSIKKSRLVDAFKIMGQEATRAYGPQELAQLTTIFEDALGDIAEKLIESGYDRKYEYEADKLGATVGAKTGYSPQGLVDFLQTMVDQPGASDKGWFKTHPSAKDRINRAQKEIGKLKTKPAKQEANASRA